MHILPANSTTVALSRTVAGNTMTDTIEAAELLDVHMDDLSRTLALVSADRLGGLQGLQRVEPQTPQDTANRGRRDAELCRNVLAGVALAAQSLDGSIFGLRGLAGR